MARQPLGGLGRLIFRGFTITNFLDTPHSVGLLWMRDQFVCNNINVFTINEYHVLRSIQNLKECIWNVFKIGVHVTP
jgi:hypothetical protein